MATAGKGLPFIGKMNEFLDKVLHPTVQKVGHSKAGLDVIPRGYYLLNPVSTVPYVVEAGSDDNLLNLTAHGFKAGDVVRLVSTANAISEHEITIDEIVDANSFILAGYLSASLTAGDTFDCLRPVVERLASDGSSLSTVISPPIQYNRKAAGVTAATTVLEDLDTPTNSRGLPVVIHSIDGAPIIVNAGDLSVSTSHVNDSMAIGDGTTLAGVTLANELKTHDADLLAALQGAGTVDATNSSTTPLGIGGVFTGAAIEIKDYSAICVAAISDVASAASGLSMQFSPDGVNWDHIHAYDVAVGGVSYTQASELRYFRIVYTNGATAQAYFRLTTILKRHNVMPSRYTFAQGITGTQFADNVKAVIHGLTTGGGGGYVPVKVNPSGALTVESTVTSSALPTGAATEVTSAAILAELALKADLTETQPVSVASLPLPSGAATEATLALIKAKTDNLDVSLNTIAKDATVLAGNGLIGAVNEAAPASDTASSGLNGRLQRIAQNISSLITQLPATLGIKTAAASLSVAPASDAIFNTKDKALTGSYAEKLTLTTVDTFTAPANAIGAIVQADDANAASFRAKQGAAATATSGIQFQAGRSEEFKSGSDISVCSEGASVKVYVQWFIQA